jgi:hypothetical protein
MLFDEHPSLKDKSVRILVSKYEMQQTESIRWTW